MRPEALDQRVSKDRTLPREVIVAFNHALIESRRYMAECRKGAGRNYESEQQLSALWLSAAEELYPHDPELANRCMVKGNGWVDESVWDDPRYHDLPLKLNDMMERIIQIGGSHARDIIEGECEVDTLTWRTRVKLPPFKEAPQITLFRLGSGSTAEPNIESISPDQFTIAISNSDQRGKWAWRARGTLLR